MIRKLVLIALTIVLILAAASMTALFICQRRRPTAAAFLTASAAQPVRLPDAEGARFDARSEWWYYTGFLTGDNDHRKWPTNSLKQ